MLFRFWSGVARNGIDINALLSVVLPIDKNIQNGFNSIMQYFSSWKACGDPDTKAETAIRISILVNEELVRIKTMLGTIRKPEDISTEHCCIARLMIIYQSMLSILDGEDEFIGFDDGSLGLDGIDEGIREQVENRLVTVKRTGLLGAYLLRENPYVFAYKKSGAKKGRRYYSRMVIADDKKFILLVALKERRTHGEHDALSAVTNELEELIISERKRGISRGKNKKASFKDTTEQAS